MSDDALGRLLEDADWPELTRRLLLVARRAVGKYAPEDRRHFARLCSTYTQRAVDELLQNGLDGGLRTRTLFQVLASILLELAERDDRQVTKTISTADWDDVTRRVLAYTVRKHGPDATRSGKDPSDRLNEAVTILLERRHHYPYYRGISLVAFLCTTIDGIVSHDAEKLKSQGQQLRIVSRRGGAAAGELSEEELPATTDEPRDVIAMKRRNDFTDSLEPELQKYAHLRARESSWTAKQFAEALQTSVQQIRNWDRKLRRRWNKMIR